MISLIVSIIPTIISAILLWVLLVTTEEQKNTYYALLFITVFIVNLAYFFTAISRSTLEALTAYKFTYFGGTFLTLFMYKCVLEICNVRTYHIRHIPLILANVEVLVVVFLAGFKPWHYEWVSLYKDDNFTYLEKVYGPHHTVYLIVLAVNMFLPFYGVIWAFFHRRQASWKHALLLTFAEVFSLCVYIGERLLSLKVELLPYTYITAEIIFLIILRRIAIYDIKTNVQLSLARADEQGYLLLDTRLRYMGADDVAKRYFPELTKLELDRFITDEFMNGYKDWVRSSLKESPAPLYMERCGDIVKVTVRPFYKKDGKKLAGYMLQILNDTETQNYIRELKESRDLANKMAKEAEEANRYKSEFLANISHEIRTPINAVLGFNEMVIRESEDEKIRNYAVDIKKSGDTMLGLINDLLDISKIESGKMELVPVTFDLVALLNDIINVTTVRALDKGLEFEPVIDPDTPRYLYGDEVRIKQIFTNLLTNAVKYTQKGTVTLTVSGERTDNKTVVLFASIADTGIGMKKETIDQIFVPYERVDREKNRHIEGTGLGLPITRMLLKLMNSSLEVKSDYGVGSDFTFEIELPVSSEETVGNLSDSIRALHDNIKEYKVSFTAPDAHVLIVDDTSINIRIFRGLLKRTLVQIDSADSGAEAIEMTKAKKYDVIFLDHMMPGMDGVETFGHIKSDEGNLNHHTPIIMMTANVSSDSRDQYMGLGFDDYIGKPVDPLLLESMLRRLL